MERYFTDRRHEELRMAVQEFAKHEVKPRISEMEAARRASVGLSRLIARQGWIGVTVPAGYGGMGIGHLGKTMVIEELSRVSGAMGAMVQASQLGVAKILHFGNEEQKKTWLPAIASGDCLPTIAVTEPESGGHVLGMTSSAVRDGDDYILNGQQGLRRQQPRRRPPRRRRTHRRRLQGPHGLPRGVRPPPASRSATSSPRWGCTASASASCIFDNCRVPAANRLGEEGDGLVRRLLLQHPLRTRQPHRRLARHPPGDPGRDHRLLLRTAALRRPVGATWAPSSSSSARCSPG